MLFEDTKYLDYKFPEPQYLGAKHIHRGWIAQFIPEDVSTVLDAFQVLNLLPICLSNWERKL